MLKEIINVRWKKALKLIMEEKPSNVLDIGCSSGDISSALASDSINVFGIDLSPEKIRSANNKGLLSIISDVSENLPFKDSLFDVVFAGEIIEHLNDTDYLLEEIHRVLKKGGKLVITVPNTANLENRLRLLLGRYPIFVDYSARGTDNHLRVYTERALTSQLKENKFKIELSTGSFMPPISYSHFKRASLFLMPVLGILGGLFPGFAIHTIIKARKN